MSNSLEFKLITKTLDEKKIHYYTHDLPSSKPVKIVWKGLFSMDINLVKKRLTENGINCKGVKRMTIVLDRPTLILPWYFPQQGARVGAFLVLHFQAEATSDLLINIL